MESTTGRAPEPAASETSEAVGAERAAKPAATPKSGAKPKTVGAARRKRETARKHTASKPVAAQDPPVQKPLAQTNAETFSEALASGSSLQIAEIGMELADIVTGSRSSGRGNDRGETRDEASGEYRGLTLDEVSDLLARREAKGYALGHSKGYHAARTAALVRLQRERSEAVAGALIMVSSQLEGVLADLTDGREAECARRLAVLVAEFRKASERFARGDEFPS